jgi:asparagine synthase (glutamine-hydrolysing)
MCGIIALLSRGGRVEPELLPRGLAALEHRGPDDRGSFADCAARVGLGHTRLAIIDPAGGAQPMTSEDGRVVAVVSGELYDHSRMRRELEARGHAFRSQSDSEILVHLWQERGSDCLADLRGEFAFVLWDGERKRLFAARDRFGVRPLLYAEHQGVLYLASEAKALFAMGVPAAWDEDALGQAARMHYTLPSQTLFRGVRQLEPGCFLDAEAGELKLGRYWDLDFPPELEERDDPDAVELVRAELIDAVRLRLESDVPFCFQLSGGLDSSAVLGLAAKSCSRPLHAFTVSFEDPEYDEHALAEATAERAGATLTRVRATQHDLVAALPDAVAQAESLAVNLHLPAKLLLSRAIRDAGYKVVLTGEGADEVFAGYAHLRRDLFSNDPEMLRKIDASNRASTGSMLPSGRGLDVSAVEERLGFVPSFLSAKATLGSKLNELSIPDDRDAYRCLLDHVDVEGQLAGRSCVHQSLYLWSKTALAGYILRAIGDGMEMASSVEGRVPYLDHHLFERVRALAVSWKIRAGSEKHVLRRAVADVVPEAILSREKHPFLAPPLGDGELVRDVLGSRRFASVPGFSVERARRVLERLKTMPETEQRAWDPALTLATTAVLLGERYGL